MSYLALARKYRPQDFSEVVGQKHIVRTLSNAILQERIAHAYLFIGPRGIGKTSIARIFAKSLNCAKGPTPQPCGVCDSCAGITAGSSLDIIEIDAASNRKVEEVREILDNVPYMPSQSRFKVYIIDEVHMLSTHAFNALLKILEEPPAHVIFIFATTEPAKIPETIVSRCQRFVFKRMTRDEIKTQLKHITEKEGKEAEEEALEILADAADGSMRDGQSLLDQVIAYADEGIKASHVEMLTGALEEILSKEIITLLAQKDFNKILDHIGRCENQGADFQVLLSKLSRFIRDLLLFRESRESALLFHESQSDFYRELSPSFPSETLVLMNDLLAEATRKIRFLSEKRIFMEFLLYKMVYAETLFSVASVPVKANRTKPETHTPAQDKTSGPFSWKESALEKAGEENSLYPILEKARFAVNNKGILFLGWEDPYYFKQAQARKDQIIETVHAVESGIPVRLMEIKKKGAPDQNPAKEKKTKKQAQKEIPEQILEFKNAFNGEIIEQRRNEDA